jgi:hypothetical protein
MFVTSVERDSVMGLKQWLALILLLLGQSGLGAHAAELADTPLVLSENRVRLGTTGAPEWESFTNDPPSAQRLDLNFNAQSSFHEATLFIRQEDVRQDWFVELNGKRLGKLFLMEADLVQHLSIPPGVLRDGENVLSILPPKEKDDIIIHEVRIDPRPPDEVLAEATLSALVTDDQGKALPCRLTIVDSRGTLAALLSPADNVPSVAVRPGVVYTGNGRAEIGLQGGDYTVFASRGFEWNVATQQVHVVSSQMTPVTLSLRREVPTPGWVSCDTHVHTFTHSRHGDATVEERMFTLAGEGIELPIATDHNLNIDYSETARRTDTMQYFTSVTGNEVTTPAGHFNIFPVQRDARIPDFKLTDWPRLMEEMRATPNVRVVVLNHPRNVHSNFQPFAATNFNAVSGENLRGPEFTFDAMELLNSSAQQSDHLLVFRDWFALLNHGYRITAVGSSDSHDVSRYIVGQGRTYIACPDADPGRLDTAAACSNLIAGRALVSMGLLADITVEDRFGVGDLATRLPKSVRVQVRVLGPSWVSATNVMLFANGVVLREHVINPNSPNGLGVKAVVNWTIPRPAHDVHLIALATGPEVTAPFWAIPKPYQPTSPKWTGRVIAATNPVWLDADGDGRFTAARVYARKLIGRSVKNPKTLLSKLGRFDEATAAQAGSLCAAAGADINSAAFRQALASAAESVRRGFESFAATQK